MVRIKIILKKQGVKTMAQNNRTNPNRLKPKRPKVSPRKRVKKKGRSGHMSSHTKK